MCCACTKAKRIIALFNTHLDYSSDNDSLKRVAILQKIISDVKKEYLTSVIISGYFNQYPSSETIKYLTNKHHSVYDDLKNIGLTFNALQMRLRDYRSTICFTQITLNLKSLKSSTIKAGISIYRIIIR